jgi:hypothetical protein
MAFASTDLSDIEWWQQLDFESAEPALFFGDCSFRWDFDCYLIGDLAFSSLVF